MLAAARVVERTDGMPVIGVGGVRSAEDVRQYLRVGPRWWRSVPGPWPTRGCRNGSCVTWSAPMAEVILALDLPGGAEAMRLLDRLPEIRWVKVGIRS